MEGPITQYISCVSAGMVAILAPTLFNSPPVKLLSRQIHVILAIHALSKRAAFPPNSNLEGRGGNLDKSPSSRDFIRFAAPSLITTIAKTHPPSTRTRRRWKLHLGGGISTLTWRRDRAPHPMPGERSWNYDIVF